MCKNTPVKANKSPIELSLLSFITLFNTVYVGYKDTLTAE